MKNISAKFVLKVAGTLTIISLIVALLLGVVNSFTEDRIAELKEETTKASLAAVAPEGAEFTAVELSDEAYAAASAQSATLEAAYSMSTGGYAITVVASGSQGSIEMVVGVDENGAITGISIIDNSETAGIGSKVMSNQENSAGVPVLDQFIGMSGSGSLVVGKTVTAISGATVSTKGVTKGANAALAVAELLG